MPITGKQYIYADDDKKRVVFALGGDVVFGPEEESLSWNKDADVLKDGDSHVIATGTWYLSDGNAEVGQRDGFVDPEVDELKPDVVAVDKTPKDFKRVGESDAVAEARKSEKPKPAPLPPRKRH